MSVGDWFSYDFIGDHRDPQAELTVRFKLQAAQGHRGGALEVQLDGQTLGSINTLDGEWRLYGDIDLGVVEPGEHFLTLRCTEGPLRLMWFTLDKKS